MVLPSKVQAERGKIDVGKSERLIVPVKSANSNPRGVDGGKQIVEILNRYWETYQMPRQLNNVLTVQQRIATLAQRSPDFAFFSLAHYIDLYWLEEAYHRTRKDGAAGTVSTSTSEDYSWKVVKINT